MHARTNFFIKLKLFPQHCMEIKLPLIFMPFPCHFSILFHVVSTDIELIFMLLSSFVFANRISLVEWKNMKIERLPQASI